MHKKYSLDTINQIVDVVNEQNIDVFMNDFRQFLEMRIAIKELNSTIAMAKIKAKMEMGKTFFGPMMVSRD